MAGKIIIWYAKGLKLLGCNTDEAPTVPQCYEAVSKNTLGIKGQKEGISSFCNSTLTCLADMSKAIEVEWKQSFNHWAKQKKTLIWAQVPLFFWDPHTKTQHKTVPFSAAHLQHSVALGNRHYQEENKSISLCYTSLCFRKFSKRAKQVEHVLGGFCHYSREKNVPHSIYQHRKQETQVRFSFTANTLQEVFFKSRQSYLYFPSCLHLEL